MMRIRAYGFGDEGYQDIYHLMTSVMVYAFRMAGDKVHNFQSTSVRVYAALTTRHMVHSLYDEVCQAFMLKVEEKLV